MCGGGVKTITLIQDLSSIGSGGMVVAVTAAFRFVLSLCSSVNAFPATLFGTKPSAGVFAWAGGPIPSLDYWISLIKARWCCCQESPLGCVLRNPNVSLYAYILPADKR